MKNNQTHQFKRKLEQSLDKHFPKNKGYNERGSALMMFADACLLFEELQSEPQPPSEEELDVFEQRTNCNCFRTLRLWSEGKISEEDAERIIVDCNNTFLDKLAMQTLMNGAKGTAYTNEPEYISQSSIGSIGNIIPRFITQSFSAKPVKIKRIK